MGRLVDAATFGPARRRRELGRRLRALDRSDTQAGVGPPRRDRQLRALTVLAACLTAAFATTFFLNHDPGAAAVAVRMHAPPPGIDEAAGPLAVPEPAPAGMGGYAFEQTQTDGRAPVTWDPCRPIRYAVHGVAPAGAETLVDSAVAEISAASGMVFVPVGATDELPATKRSPYQPDRYGDRWAPLVIAWTDPAATPGLAGDAIGLGGGISVPWANGHRTYVSGTVWLDEPQFRDDLARRPASERVLHAAVMHELGHVLGLGHVEDPRQVMYPEARLQATALGDGDRRGLVALWQGRCAPGL